MTVTLKNWKLDLGAGGLPRLVLSIADVESEVYLQGAHLTRVFDKTRNLEMLWMHPTETIEPGRPLRGGVPVCFPWFAQNAPLAGYPNHGFARNLSWGVMEEFESNGMNGVRLRLVSSELTRAFWNHMFEATMHIAVGAGRIELALAIKNVGKEPFTFENAFHPYFPAPPNSLQTKVEGLDGAEYIDKVDGHRRLRQEGALNFGGSTDKVFLDTSTACVLHHPGRPSLLVEKSGSRETVVWNPGPPLNNPGGPPAGFLCIEQANCADHPVTLPPGETHELRANYAFTA